MPDKKIVFNISFHHQLENMKFHLDTILNWHCSDNMHFVITTAHEQNMNIINSYVRENYPSKKVNYMFVTTDHGYNLGTIKNVTEGIRFIKNNIECDYVVNAEGDNMFYFEDRLLYIIDQMQQQTKHLLLVEEGNGQAPHTNFPHRTDIPKYFHFTTLNIFSKLYIENCFPFEYYADVIDIRWMDRPYTPYEAYMGLATIKKNNLTESNQMAFYNTMGLRLDYDRHYNPFGWNEPDNMVPDKFLKWGMINAPSTAGNNSQAEWHRMREFAHKHLPLKTI